MIKSEKGFSLIELVIGLTVLSLISVAVGTSFLNIFSNQQNVANQSTVTGIDSALSNYFKSSEFCASSLENLSVTGSKQRLVVKGFEGMGSTGADLESGSLIGGQVLLANVTIRYNSSIPAVDTYFNGATARARAVDISYNFKTRKAFAEKGASYSAITDDPNAWLARKEHTVLVPVKIQGGRIVSCDGANSPESACAAVGGSWIAGKCEPKASCVYKGTFISWSCSGVRSDTVCGDTFQGILNDLDAIDGDDGASIQGTIVKNPTNGGVTNPRTGAFSCPDGSTKTFTGRDTHQYTLSCGKKCSYTVTQAADFFSCRKCDVD
jgi:prepilin-type N-terminal cleavage/methylation domain-containing protein